VSKKQEKQRQKEAYHREMKTGGKPAKQKKKTGSRKSK